MSANGLLTREQLLARTKRRYRYVDLPAGGRLRVQSLTEREKSALESDMTTRDRKLNRDALRSFNRRLIVLTVVDDQGNRLLQAEDVETLQEVDGAITGQLVREIAEHCGFDDGDIEELAGNWPATTGADSPTD